MNAVTEKHADRPAASPDADASRGRGARARRGRSSACRAWARSRPIWTGLSPADARLAAAIVRHGVQRWFTLEARARRTRRSRSTAELEPRLRGVLMAAAAQIVFMDRLPDYAVVDRGVDLAGRLVRRGAAKPGQRRAAQDSTAMVGEPRAERRNASPPPPTRCPWIGGERSPGSGARCPTRATCGRTSCRGVERAAADSIDRWFERWGEAEAGRGDVPLRRADAAGDPGRGGRRKPRCTTSPA